MKVKVIAVCQSKNAHNIGTVGTLIRLVPHDDQVPEVNGRVKYGTGYLVEYPDGTLHFHDVLHLEDMEGNSLLHEVREWQWE